MNKVDWWSKPRRVSVVVDNDSWILPFAKRLVEIANKGGDRATLIRSYDDVEDGDVGLFLGCTKLAPARVLDSQRICLVVHESALPKGRGFAPLAWQILAGKNEIPICLLEAKMEADSGSILLEDVMRFEGHELNDELRKAQGEATIALVTRYLDQPEAPGGRAQCGSPTRFKRRARRHSELDPEKTIAEQFELLRVVDNDRYPAFFEYRGARYALQIEKLPSDPGEA